MNLREAAAQVVQAYDAHDSLAVVMEDLRAALAEDAMQRLTDIQQEMERTGCDHCNSPLWCGTKCSNCGKVWEWASGIEGEPNDQTTTR